MTTKIFRPLSLKVIKLQPFKVYYSHWSKMSSHRPTLETITIWYKMTAKIFRPLSIKLIKNKVYYSHWSKMSSHRATLVGWCFDFNSSVLSSYYVIPVLPYCSVIPYCMQIEKIILFVLHEYRMPWNFILFCVQPFRLKRFCQNVSMSRVVQVISGTRKNKIQLFVQTIPK